MTADDEALGQDLAGSLGRMGETGGHRLDLDGHGAYVASREDPTALDTRMGNGPDDNRAQAGHLVTNERAVEDVTHSLTSGGHDASEDGTGRGTPLVAGTLTSGQGPQRLDDQNVGGGHLVASDEGITSFDAEFSNHGVHGTPDESGALTRKLRKSVAIQTYTKRHGAASAEDGENWDESDTSRTLTGMNMPGDLAAVRSLVRRLSPTECERLQGLPDGWTLPYGPSLADAPAWYELDGPPPVNHSTFNALPDQKRRDSGEMKGAVELRETDRSLTLDTSGRDPSAFNGGMMVVPTDGKDEASTVTKNYGKQPDSSDRNAGPPNLVMEVRSVTENDEMVFESDQTGSLTSGGGKPGQGYPVVHQTYSVSGGGGEDADLRAVETEDAETLTTRGAWAYTQGGTLVDQQADHLDSIEAEVPEQPRAEAGTVRSHMRPGSNSDDVVLGFKTDGDERSSVSAGETAPTMRGAEAGTTAVAFTQNQREELRELDAAGSLSGQGTHQTTYVATSPVADGRACPFDCPPDGPRYSSLGDAVTSPVAQWIGERLVDVLRERGVIGPDGEVGLTADLSDA